MRVLLGALLLEIVLFAVLVPISFVNMTLFVIAVPIGVFVFGYLVTKWVLRNVTSGRLVNAFLIGVVATAIYFGLVLMQPGGLAAALAVYGAPMFYLVQALRIAGCVAGAAGRRR